MFFNFLLIWILLGLINALIYISFMKYFNDYTIYEYDDEDWFMLFLFSVVFPLGWICLLLFIVDILKSNKRNIKEFITKERTFFWNK